MANQTAKFWKYTGNHSDGRNRNYIAMREGYDPYSFGLDLISFLYCLGNGILSYKTPLTFEHVNKIDVIILHEENSGHEVSVTAPSEVWELAKEVNYHAYLV